MNILIGVDDSPESQDAVRAAFRLFGPDAAYTVVSVGRRLPSAYGPLFGIGYPGGGFVTADALGAQFDDAKSTAEATARSAKRDLPSVDVEVEAEVGDPGVELCRIAVDHHSDVIVIGSHDRSVWHRLFDPSVGRYLVDHAPCPVLVVR